jgi:serine/threonine-protein kinase
MSVVWGGYDRVLRRAVAVKVLHPQLASDLLEVERFREKAIAGARVSHPNAVAVYDGELSECRAPFVVVELVRGPTLRQHLSSQRLLLFDTALTMGIQIAGALSHAHAAGVVHPEIKPTNVLLERTEGAGWRVKLTGFTMAKAYTAVGPRPRGFGAGIDCDESAMTKDLCSLGVLLFEMLIGRPPWPRIAREVLAANCACHCHPHVREIRPGIPAELDALVAGLLCASPGDQLPSALDVHAGLMAISASQSMVRIPQSGRGPRTTSDDGGRSSMALHPATRRSFIWARRSGRGSRRLDRRDA